MSPRYATALVTGASSGIGEAFARRLHRDGSTLLLAARRQDRLVRLARELGSRVHIVAVDLSTPEGRDRLFAEAARLGGPPDLFVNNAGFGLLGPFVELPRERQLEMIRINVEAVTDLAHRYLAARREGGALLNVASVVGLRPVPLHATYAATKAFVVSLSLSLAVEAAPRGTRVLALCPGPVPTEFQEIAGVKLDGGSARVVIPVDQVVEEGLEALGRNAVLHVPGLRMRLAIRLLGLLPQGIVARLGAALNRRRRPTPAR
jgi:uncharacterized protein